MDGYTRGQSTAVFGFGSRGFAIITIPNSGEAEAFWLSGSSSRIASFFTVPKFPAFLQSFVSPCLARGRVRVGSGDGSGTDSEACIGARHNPRARHWASKSLGQHQ